MQKSVEDLLRKLTSAGFTRNRQTQLPLERCSGTSNASEPRDKKKAAREADNNRPLSNKYRALRERRPGKDRNERTVGGGTRSPVAVVSSPIALGGSRRPAGVRHLSEKSRAKKKPNGIERGKKANVTKIALFSGGDRGTTAPKKDPRKKKGRAEDEERSEELKGWAFWSGLDVAEVHKSAR